MALSGKRSDSASDMILTGNYNNRFNLIDPILGKNMEY